MISAAEESLKIAQAELDQLTKRIGGYKSTIARYKQQSRGGLEVDVPGYQRALRERNLLVDQYNQKLSEYNKDYADYEKRIEQDKLLVEQYNALVRK